MSYVQLPERTSADSNSASDANTLQDNIEALKGGVGATAPTTTIEDLSSDKADKVTSPTAGNFAALNANGNLTDSGVAPADIETLSEKPKKYVQTSAGAGAYTVTGLGDGSTANDGLTYAVLIPYQTDDASWRLRFNIVGVLDSAATSITIVISGVTFAGANAAIATFCYGTLGSPSTGIVQTGGGNILIWASSSSTNWRCSGDVDLNAAPTWAD